jgi:thiosulfate/3-mercaptopyruvate sulfurtransferase
MKTAHGVALMLGALAMTGCEVRPPTEPASFPALEVSARAPDLVRVPVATRPQLLVSVDWVVRNAGRPNVVILHVGTAGNYNAGHVPGAWFVNLAALQSTQDEVPFMLNSPSSMRSVLEAAGVSTSHHVIVTGDGMLQAARGFFILEYLGHPRVSLLDGGRAAWQSENELSTEPSVADWPGRMTPPVWPQRLATAEWIQDRLGSSGTILVDARSVADYNAARIPGAANLPWGQLVESVALPLLKPVEDLRARFVQTGADVRSEVVTYCVSGMMSSMSYFVARYLGYDVRLYDGSMLEWTALGLPLES